MMQPVGQTSNSVHHYRLVQESNKVCKGLYHIAEELDYLKEKDSAIQSEVKQLTLAECYLINELGDDLVSHYNDVIKPRFDLVKKKVAMLREKRNLALEDLLKIRTRRAELEVKTEMLAYRQGEVCWDGRLDALKRR